VVLLVACAARGAAAQDRPALPMTRADSLLEAGRWSEAEAAFYAQSERAPRSPTQRAALGQFVAMKGAVRPGITLIDEARKFGLDPDVARELVTPLRAILAWRTATTGFARDSTFPARPASTPEGLFQIAFPRTDAVGQPLTDPTGVTETVWHDVVDRAIGLDSVRAPGRPIGIEVFEALTPSMNVSDGEITLHANPRSALGATGKRYQVLRSTREVRVLLGDRRVLRLADALREIAPSWWQLDLVHGILVVR
jgi:hypothetical protein